MHSYLPTETTSQIWIHSSGRCLIAQMRSCSLYLPLPGNAYALLFFFAWWYFFISFFDKIGAGSFNLLWLGEFNWCDVQYVYLHLNFFYWYFVLFSFTFYLHFWCILLLYSERQNCIVWYMNIVKVTMDARVYSFPLFCLWKVLAYMIACAVKFECKNNFKIYSVLDVSFEFASFDRNFCNWRFDGNDEAFLVSFFQIPSDVYVFFQIWKANYVCANVNVTFGFFVLACLGIWNAYNAWVHFWNTSLSMPLSGYILWRVVIIIITCDGA